MKTVLFTLIIGISMLSALQSCSDDVAPAPTTNNGDDTTDNSKTNTELLLRKWKVEEAYVDGSTPDGSSKGLEIEFKDMGSYTLFMKDGSTFDGTWEFVENETKIDIDKNGQFAQTWTIETLNESTLDVNFVSPFTGQNARWLMK